MAPLEIVLRGGVTAPWAARRALDSLEDQLDAALFGDVRLVASELVTNAIEQGRAGAGELVLRATVLRGTVRVEVSWHVVEAPEPREGTLAALGLDERAFFIVARLSQRWGVEAGHGTSSVWAEIDGPTRAPEAHARNGDAAMTGGEEEAPPA
jgi:hypothetical protein